MDSELIEKARLAFVEAWEARSAEDGPLKPGDRSRAGIRAAAAVFEAAQKPTDDEREALIMALVHTVEYVGTDMLPAAEGWSWYDALAKYAPERLNGFRRPASPAPSADEEPRGAGPWLRD